jgi:hypothetical protein
MDNMIKEKDQMEQELFEKFALLMEEKKVKIRELTAQSSVKTNETAHEDPPVEPPAKRGRRKKTTG